MKTLLLSLVIAHADAAVGFDFGPAGTAKPENIPTLPAVDPVEKALADAKKLEGSCKDEAAKAYVAIVRSHRWNLDCSAPALITALRLRSAVKDPTDIDALAREVFGETKPIDPSSANATLEAATALCRKPWSGRQELTGTVKTSLSRSTSNGIPDPPRWNVSMVLASEGDGWGLTTAPNLTAEAHDVFRIRYQDGTTLDLPARTTSVPDAKTSGYYVNCTQVRLGKGPVCYLNFSLGGFHADKVIERAEGKLLCSLPLRWLKFSLPIRDGARKKAGGLEYEILVSKVAAEGLRVSLSSRVVDRQQPWWRAIAVDQTPLPKSWRNSGPIFELVSASKRIGPNMQYGMTIGFGDGNQVGRGTMQVGDRVLVHGDCEIGFQTPTVQAIGKPKALEIRQVCERVAFVVPFVWENVKFVDKR